MFSTTLISVRAQGWLGTSGSCLQSQLLGRQRSGGNRFKASPREIVYKTLSQKYPTQEKASRVVQVVEHLPSKHEVLSSNTCIAKKKPKADLFQSANAEWEVRRL
jgi:hypothetical protein